MENYLIHPAWFYLMSICNKVFVVSMIMSVLIFVVIMMELSSIDFDLDGVNDRYMNIIKRTFIAFLISIVLIIFIPTEKTIIPMMVASKITSENIEKAKNEAKNAVDYIVDKIKEIK